MRTVQKRLKLRNFMTQIMVNLYSVPTQILHHSQQDEKSRFLDCMSCKKPGF